MVAQRLFRWRKPAPFAAHEQHERRRIDGLPIVDGSRRGRADDANTEPLLPGGKIRQAGACQTLRKDGAGAGAHSRRIVRIGRVSDQDDPSAADRVADPQDSPQIAGILHGREGDPAEHPLRL